MLHNSVTHGLCPTMLCRCWPAYSASFSSHEASSLFSMRRQNLSLRVALTLAHSVINWLASLINGRSIEAFS